MKTLKRIGSWLLDKWLAGFLTGSFFFIGKIYYDLQPPQREHFFQFNWLKYLLQKPVSLWVVVLLVTFVIGMFLLTKALKKRSKVVTYIDYRSFSEEGKYEWKTIFGSPDRRVITDETYGQCMKFTGVIGDASDIEIFGLGQKGQILGLLLNPDRDFIIYVKLALTGNFGTRSVSWIAFKDIRTPKKVDPNEWEYPIKLEHLQYGWGISRKNLVKIVEETFGTEQRQFREIVAIRVRGTALINNISIT